MSDTVFLNGVVLNTASYGEYGKRLTVLTIQRGKITVFANGVRRPGNSLMAAANPFVFGEFELREGKNAYNAIKVNVKNYFRELLEDPFAVYYGTYFLELCDYYAVENTYEKNMVNLLYLALKNLLKENVDKELIRRIVEFKLMVINGEYPSIEEIGGLLPKPKDATVYAIDYIYRNPVEKLFSFALKEDVLAELGDLADRYMNRFCDKEFKSKDILNQLLKM